MLVIAVLVERQAVDAAGFFRRVRHSPSRCLVDLVAAVLQRGQMHHVAAIGRAGPAALHRSHLPLAA
jgi:hypothetical protein